MLSYNFVSVITVREKKDKDKEHDSDNGKKSTYIREERPWGLLIKVT